LKRKLIDGAYVFANIIDSVAAPKGRRAFAEHIVSKAETRAPVGSILVVERCWITRASQTRNVQLIYTGRIHVRILSNDGQSGNRVADMAEIVVNGSVQLPAEPQVQSQIGSNFVVILGKQGEVIDLVLMVRYAAAAITECWRAQQELLKIGAASRARSGGSIARAEEYLPVEDLGEILVEIDAICLAPEPEQMLPIRPACGVQENEVILQLRDIGCRGWSNLKAGAVQRELIDQVIHIVIRAVNSQLVHSRNGRIDVLTVNPHKAEAKFVHPGGREDMRFRDIQEAVPDGQIIRKVQIAGRDAGAE